MARGYGKDITETADIEQQVNLKTTAYHSRGNASGPPKQITHEERLDKEGIALRMLLHDLQKQISELVVKICMTNNASRKRMNKARTLMAAYVNVVKDYGYMVDKANEAKELQMADPFEITSEDKLGSYLLNDLRVLSRKFRINDDPIYDQEKGEKGQWQNTLPGVSRHETTKTSNQALIWERLSMGLAGGVAIIAPVLVMVLRRDLLTSGD
ncbi:hypothetical protein K4K55_002976 [Colletotrichum sp. SAR 10_96]|nr:hypothetical protein K4K55_002976 [Colletotrichum sp. SAR 10_96]